MEIEVKLEDLSRHDTGGGMRWVRAWVSVGENLSPRIKRKVLFYEVLGCCLDYVLSHDQLEDLADVLVDALDQLEPI